MALPYPVLELPDIHERWPFPVTLNRWEDTISTESLAWIESLCILSAPELRKFKAANYAGLTSIVYASVTDVHHYRAVCDLIHLLFIVDDLTDELSAVEVQGIAEISLDALRFEINQLLRIPR